MLVLFHDKKCCNYFNFVLCIYASPLWLSPLTNVHEVEFFPPKIMNVSHIEITKHTGILSSILCLGEIVKL